MIQTQYGLLEGIDKENCDVYFGIPYAKPPVGDRRWCAPEKPEQWSGVLQAKAIPNRCPQTDHEVGSFYHKEFFSDPAYLPAQSEDCLYLNIWTPKNPQNCPVAVWFHGGALQAGNNADVTTDGEGYAKRDIILVSVNYRLGLFGFFAHSELHKRDGHSGNYGLLDQIAAIQWVRENIAAFGGDPECITVFGQSAGGMSVRALCASPLAQGLFHRAIIQSGGGYHSLLPVGISGKRLEKAGAKFLKRKKMTLSQFYALPEQELVKLAGTFLKESILTVRSVLPLADAVDGYSLTLDFDKAAEHGKLARIPYLIGCNANDPGDKKTDYTKKPMKNHFYRSNAHLAKKLHSMGIPCYSYYFKRQMPGDEEGAFHSAELWYTFGTLDRCWRPLTEDDRRLSEEMMDAWASFMKTGDPGWPQETTKNWDIT